MTQTSKGKIEDIKKALSITMGPQADRYNLQAYIRKILMYETSYWIVLSSKIQDKPTQQKGGAQTAHLTFLL